MFNIVFERVTNRHKYNIYYHAKRKRNIYLIEPFYAYHHKRGLRFYPQHVPSYVQDLVKVGKINLITAQSINAREIYSLASDKAVSSIESAYPTYRDDHQDIIKYVSDALGSSISEDAFKKELCNRLAEFYSVNIMMHRVEQLIGQGPIFFYPDTNVHDYLYLMSIITKSKLDHYTHASIRFPPRTRFTAFIENTERYMIALTRMTAQVISSMLFGSNPESPPVIKAKYAVGVTIISPSRQLSDNQRGPEFIVDNDKIRPEDVVYFPLTKLTDEQKDQLGRKPGTTQYLPEAGRFFSHPKEWSKLLRTAVKKNIGKNTVEINTACKILFSYLQWLTVLKTIRIEHLISHCDFDAGHIGRNIALSQAKIDTWYFTDSMNFGSNLITDDAINNMRHPFWSYLHYDHFVTWNAFLVRYFSNHPGSFNKSHVVGCLWSSHANGVNSSNNKSDVHTARNRDRFIIAVFDSTYSLNGITSYSEGIAFADHVYRLVLEHPDVHVYLKEKKDRAIHRIFDPERGPLLLKLYNTMATHPRITFCSHQVDSSEIISRSGMVISFPFTSTTFEALTINTPAIWHDPLDFYKNTPYGRIRGLTTHSYEQLMARVSEIRSLEPGQYINPIPKDSDLMDPYRDRNAIDRFRALLVADRIPS